VIETNHDEKLLQNDTPPALAGETAHPVAARTSVQHGCGGVIEDLLPGKIDRVVLGHLSRDCNTPALALSTVRASLEKCGRNDVETYCATQFEISSDSRSARPSLARFNRTFGKCFFQSAL